MDSLAVVVLAAGLGKRMGSNTPKSLIELAGTPLLGHVFRTIAELAPERLVVVTGAGRDQVEAYARTAWSAAEPPLTFAFQEQQLGTGHAAKIGMEAIEGFIGTVLILYADTPLVSAGTLKRLLAGHAECKATLSLITMRTSQENSFGRVIRDPRTGTVKKIVEARDCTTKEYVTEDLNSGVYAVDSAFLVPALDKLKNENAQGEYYLTDVVGLAVAEGQTVEGFALGTFEELQGINDRFDLSQVERTLHSRSVRELLRSGTRLLDPATFHMEHGCSVAPGAVIGPNVQLLGTTSVAAGAIIDGNAWLKDCEVGEGAHLRIAIRGEGARIGKDAKVGPFAHLRPGTTLEDEVHIGNFVETKNAALARGAKANHLTYLGDCSIGSKTNVGAGTITCNYDGYEKSRTEIGAGVFIGSNTALVAPVSVADGATIGAGSVITQPVEADALAVTRAALTVKPGWAKRKRELMQGKAEKRRG